MKKNTKSFVIICTSISLLYIFLASRPLAKELQFKTLWTIDATRKTVQQDDTSSSPDKTIPFKLGQITGYFTTDGKISSVFSFPYKAVISETQYAVYGSGDNSIEVNSMDGTKKGTIPLSGFPFFQNENKYVMLPGGNSFAKINDDCSVKYTYENYAPITAFSSSKAGTIAGYADGTVLIFNDEGKVENQYSPGGSHYNIILGAAISPEGTYTAAISGRDKQRFTLAKKEKDMTKIIFHEFLKNETPRQVLIKFSKDEKRCFYECGDGLGIIDISRLKAAHIPFKGNILSIQESESTNTVYVLSRHNSRYSVHVIEKIDRYAGSFSFDADHAFIAAKDNFLFVGKDSSITKIQIERN